MSERTARVRIGKCTFKNGFALLRPVFGDEKTRLDAERNVREAFRAHGNDVAGYALVVWDKKGNNTRALKGGGLVPYAMVAPYVYNILVSEYASIVHEALDSDGLNDE